MAYTNKLREAASLFIINAAKFDMEADKEKGAYDGASALLVVLQDKASYCEWELLEGHPKNEEDLKTLRKEIDSKNTLLRLCQTRILAWKALAYSSLKSAAEYENHLVFMDPVPDSGDTVL